MTVLDGRTTDGLRVVRFSPHHKPAIALLMRRLWSPDVVLNTRYFEWRCEKGGPAGESLVYLVVKEDQPVAMRVLHTTLWEAGAEGVQPLYLSDDLVVAKEFEGRGIFSLFTETIRRDLAAIDQHFFLSLSALGVTQHLSLKAGAIAVGPVHPVGVRSPTAQACDVLRSIAARLPRVWIYKETFADCEHAKHFFARLDAARSGPLHVSAQARAGEMAALIASLPWDGRLRQHRDGAYFAWRYLNPLHEYRFIYAEREGQLAGYLVVERGVSGHASARRAHIVDWEAESSELRHALLQYVLAKGGPAELVTWRETARSDATFLRECGFRPVDPEQTARGRPAILVCPVTPGLDAGGLRLGSRSLLDLDAWDLRLADTSYC